MLAKREKMKQNWSRTKDGRLPNGRIYTIYEENHTHRELSDEKSFIMKTKKERKIRKYLRKMITELIMNMNSLIP